MEKESSSDLLQERSEPFAGCTFSSDKYWFVNAFTDGPVDGNALAPVLVQNKWHRLVISEPSSSMAKPQVKGRLVGIHYWDFLLNQSGKLQ